MSSSGFPVARSRGRWREELPGSPWRWLLAPAWCAYRPVVAVRGLLYDLGWASSTRLSVPVVSVGNLTAGGTGKTPLVAYLAAWCAQRGLAPAVLSRGYGGDGRSNDEAALIDACPVVCDPDRIRGGSAAIAGGAHCLILDDGFQHRRLHRDLDLVVIDATRAWGAPGNRRGALLPLGYLREAPRSLRRADMLAVSRGESVSASALAELLAQLAATGKPVIQLREEDPHLRPMHGTGRASIESLTGRPVLLASGIGNPLGFEAAAWRHGWTVVGSRRFPDHHRYDAADAQAIAAEASRSGAVTVITSKDAVKLAPWWPSAAPVWVLEARTGIRPDDRPALDRLLERSLGLALGDDQPTP
jgi:tetraacyldisaccharide 4'-kinase